MRLIRLILPALLLSCLAHAALTRVTDTLYLADGTKASGSVVISWDQSFVAADGKLVLAGEVKRTLVDGLLDVYLEPTDTSNPVGVSYTLRYGGGRNSITLYCAMPTSGTPVLVSTICTLTGPSIPFVLPWSVAMGGTGVANPTAHYVPIAEGTSAFAFISPSNAGYVLTSNGAGLDPSFKAPQFVLSTDYAFTAQSPPENVSPSARTVTLTPCPLGVAGADTNHLLGLFSTGGGSFLEAVLINGGTCTSGAATGTLTFSSITGTYATGNYTVGSATAGIAEAAQFSKHVMIPPGTYSIYAAITPPAGTVVEGPGVAMSYVSSAATLNNVSINTPVFQMWNDNVTIKGLSLVQVGTPTAGSAGIAALAHATTSYNANTGFVESISARGFYDGLIFDGTSEFGVRDVFSYQNLQDGIRLLGAGGRFINVLAQSNVRHGIYIAAGTYQSGWARISGVETFCNHGWGVYSTLGTEIQSGVINNDWLGGIYSQYPGSSGGDSGSIIEVSIQYSGDPALMCSGSAGSNVAPGIKVAGEPVRITGAQVYGSQGNGVELGGTGINTLTGSHLYGNGLGGQAGNVYQLYVPSTLNQVSGNTVIGISKFSGNFNTVTGNMFAGNSASPMVYFSTGTFYTFCGNHLRNSGTGTAATADAGTTFLTCGNTVSVGSVVQNGTGYSSTFP